MKEWLIFGFIVLAIANMGDWYLVHVRLTKRGKYKVFSFATRNAFVKIYY